jgi:hypothetical protein
MRLVRSSMRSMPTRVRFLRGKSAQARRDQSFSRLRLPVADGGTRQPDAA